MTEHCKPSIVNHDVTLCDELSASMIPAFSRLRTISGFGAERQTPLGPKQFSGGSRLDCRRRSHEWELRRDRALRLLGNLKLHRLLCFPLNERSSVTYRAAGPQVFDPQSNEIASAKLGIDGEVEEGVLLTREQPFFSVFYKPTQSGLTEQRLMARRASLEPISAEHLHPLLVTKRIWVVKSLVELQGLSPIIFE